MYLRKVSETGRLKFMPTGREALESRISEDLNLILGGREPNNNEEQSLSEPEFTVSLNYPNPFNPVTSVSVELSVSSTLYAKVYDNTGRELETMFNGYKQKGRFMLKFNGSRLSSGVYYLKIGNGKTFVMRKLILIK